MTHAAAEPQAPVVGNHALNITLVTLNYAPEQTGVAPYSTAMAEGLAAEGHRVSVVAAAPHYPGWRILPDSEWSPRETAGGVDVTRLRSWVPSRPNFLPRAIFELLYGVKFASRSFRDCDVVVLVNPALFASLVVRLRLALMRRRPRTVLWMQDLYGAGLSETPGRAKKQLSRVIRAIEASLSWASDRVVVIHQRFQDYVVGELGVPASRVGIVRNWTHVVSPAAPDRPAVRRARGWREDETVVLHAGAIGAKQDLANVVAAARIADERQLPVRFVLLGDGSERAMLEQSGRGCERLVFIDPLPDDEFTATLASADILLVNERRGLNEAAVPSKLTTYFSTGLAVLAATELTSTTADEIRDSGAGVIALSGDPEALVEAVLNLRSRPDAVDRDAGPSYVRKRLSAAAAIAAFSMNLRKATRKIQ